MNRRKDKISKLIQKISDTVEESQEKLKIKMNDLEFRYRKLENSELTKKLERAKEFLTGDIGTGELKRVVTILQDIYDKYQVEYNKYIDIQNENAATYRFLTVTGAIGAIDKETEEVLKSEVNKNICDPDDLLE